MLPLICFTEEFLPVELLTDLYKKNLRFNQSESGGLTLQSPSVVTRPTSSCYGSAGTRGWWGMVGVWRMVGDGGGVEEGCVGGGAQ